MTPSRAVRAGHRPVSEADRRSAGSTAGPAARRPHHQSRTARATAAGPTGVAAWWPTLVFWCVVVFVGAFRYAVLASTGAPATVDSGNWLAFGEQLFGSGGRDSSIVYPPIVPTLAYLSTSAFGALHGIALLGALSSLAPGLGMYRALGKVGVGRLRIFPAILLLGAGSVSEAAAWGGFPQLLGLGLLPLALVAAIRWLDDPRPSTSFVLGLYLMVALGVSHFIAVVVIAAVAVPSVGSLVRNRSVSWTMAVLRNSPLLVIPAVWLVPTYSRMVDAVLLNSNEFAALDNLTFDNALGRLELIYADFPALWEVLIPLTLMTPLLAWSHRTSDLWRMLTALVVSTGLIVAVTHESRYLYLVPVIGAVGAALWLSRVSELEGLLRRRDAASPVRAMGVTALVAIGVLQLHGGLEVFDDHREFYGVLTPGMVDAIEAADRVAGDGIIAVPSLGDAPLGWWVEALTDADEVYYGSPLRWLNFPDEVRRATVANGIFDPTFPDADTLTTVAGQDIDVLIVPTRWAWFDEDAVLDWVQAHDLTLEFEHDDALVVAVG